MAKGVQNHDRGAALEQLSGDMLANEASTAQYSNFATFQIHDLISVKTRCHSCEKRCRLRTNSLAWFVRLAK